MCNTKTTNSNASLFGNELPKYLNRFFLKVHPDLFNKFPDIQSVNEESFKILNNILDATKDKNLSNLPHNLELKFYLLNPPQMTSSSDMAKLFKMIKTNVTELKTFDINESTARVEQKIESALYDLFYQAGLDLPKKVQHSKEQQQAISEDDQNSQSMLQQIKESLNFYQKDRKWILKELGGKVSSIPDATGMK